MMEGAPSKALLPVYIDVDATQRLQAPEHLWPISPRADPKQAAAGLARDLDIVNPRVQANVVRQLEGAEAVFADINQRTSEPRLIKFRVMVRVSTNDVFMDIVTWDLNTPVAMADVYVSRVASDLGLNRRQAAVVSNEMKKKVEQLRAQAAAGKCQFLPPPHPDTVSLHGTRRLPALMSKERVMAYKEKAEQREAAAGAAPGQEAAAPVGSPLQQAINDPEGDTGTEFTADLSPTPDSYTGTPAPDWTGV